MRSICAVLLPIFFSTQVLFAHLPETTVWAERAKPAAPETKPVRFVPPRFLNEIPSSVQNRFLPLIESLSGAHGSVRQVVLPTGAATARIVVYIQDVHQNP